MNPQTQWKPLSLFELGFVPVQQNAVVFACRRQPPTMTIYIRALTSLSTLGGSEKDSCTCNPLAGEACSAFTQTGNNGLRPAELKTRSG